jgi:hypothetical protein
MNQLLFTNAVAKLKQISRQFQSRHGLDEIHVEDKILYLDCIHQYKKKAGIM